MLPKSTSSIWDDSLSIQVFHRCRYIKLIVEIQSAAPEDAGRNFPFSSLFTQLLGFSFGFGPASACRSPEGVCSRSDRTGLKEQLIRGLWLTQAREMEGYGVWGEPAAAEAGMTLHQPKAPCVLPGKLSLDHGTLAVAGCTGSREGRCG